MSSVRPTAVCIVSGGLDSVCYAAILASKNDIYMMTFRYGQRASREVERARLFSRILKTKAHKVVDIGFMKSLYGRTNSLTDSRQELSSTFEQSLIVPIRNAVFITIATAWAMSIGAKIVAYGAHAGDSAHYPDCRPAFVSSLNDALNLAESDSIASGLRQQVAISSPAMMNLDKASLLKEGYQLLGSRIFQSWSCYSNGIKSGRGYAHCGRCESCINRKNAFITAGIEDRTIYASKGSGRPKSGKTQRDIHKH